MNTAIVYLRTNGRGLPRNAMQRNHVVTVTMSILDPNTAYTEGCRLALESIPPNDRPHWEVNHEETFLAAQTVIRITS